MAAGSGGLGFLANLPMALSERSLNNLTGNAAAADSGTEALPRVAAPIPPKLKDAADPAAGIFASTLVDNEVVAAAAATLGNNALGTGTAATGAIVGGVIAGPLWPIGALAGGAIGAVVGVGGTAAIETFSGSELNFASAGADVANDGDDRHPQILHMLSSSSRHNSGVLLTRDQLDVVWLYLAEKTVPGKPSRKRDDDGTSSLPCSSAARCTLPSVLWNLLSLFSIVGTVLGPRDSDGGGGADDTKQVDLAMKVIASRFLSCVLILDSIAFLVGKIALFEIIWLGRELGYSVVYLTLVLSSLEAVIEFASSAAMPLFYRLTYGEDKISLHRLTQFAVNAYLTSACAGMVLYCVLGVISEVLEIRTPMVFLLFIIAQAIQYPMLNQLGDQAVEMALPHWLATFEGMIIAFPGVPLASCCPAGKPREEQRQQQHEILSAKSAAGSRWHCNILAHANGDSLAYFITLLRFIYAAGFGLLYLAVSERATLRWLILIIFAIFSVCATGTMAKGLSIVKAGIADDPIEESHAPTPWPWQMKGSEISLVVFATIIFTVPQDAVTAAMTVLYASLGSKVGVLVLAGGILVIYFIARKMSEAGRLSNAFPDAAEEDVAMKRTKRGISEEKVSEGSELTLTKDMNSLRQLLGSDANTSEDTKDEGTAVARRLKPDQPPEALPGDASVPFDAASLHAKVDYHSLYLQEIHSGTELGFAGFLGDKDRCALEELSERVTSDPELDKGELAAAMAVGQETWNVFLCRWLRARNFDVDLALAMLKDHIAWRIKEDVTAIGKMTADEVLGSATSEAFQSCPHWVQGFDHQHRPYLFNALGSLDADALLENVSLTNLTRVHIWEQEQLTRLCGLKTAETGFIIDRWVTVIDLRGVRFSQYTANFRAIQKAFIAVDQANYPERNGSILIVNTPIFFPIIFSFLQSLMNPRTVARIKVLSSQSASKNLLLANLDPAHLLPEYGGVYDGNRDHIRISGCTNEYMTGGEGMCFANDRQTVCHHEKRPSTFASWLTQSISITIIILASGFLLLWSSRQTSKNLAQLLLFICCVCLVPYFLLVSDLKSRFESILMIYTEGQASGIVYYRNLFTVLFKGPILVINWYVLQAMSAVEDDTSSSSMDDDEAEDRFEQRQSAIVLAACVALVLAAVLYYVIADFCCALCGKHRSAARFVDRVVQRAEDRRRSQEQQQQHMGP